MALLTGKLEPEASVLIVVVGGEGEGQGPLLELQGLGQALGYHRVTLAAPPLDLELVLLTPAVRAHGGVEGEVEDLQQEAAVLGLQQTATGERRRVVGWVVRGADVALTGRQGSLLTDVVHGGPCR